MKKFGKLFDGNQGENASASSVLLDFVKWYIAGNRLQKPDVPYSGNIEQMIDEAYSITTNEDRRSYSRCGAPLGGISRLRDSESLRRDEDEANSDRLKELEAEISRLK